MKTPLKTGILASWIFLAALTTQGGQALAQDRDMADPCAGQEGVLGRACRDSLELLMTDTALPEAEFSISVKAGKGKWLYGYPSGDRVTGTRADQAFNCPGPLVLPRGVTVALHVTADDDLYDWSVPALGIDTTAIPGRIGTIVVKAAETGNFTGTVKTGSGKIITGGGDVHVVAPDVYADRLAKDQPQSCR